MRGGLPGRTGPAAPDEVGAVDGVRSTTSPGPRGNDPSRVPSRTRLEELAERLRVGMRMLEWRELRVRPGRCPLCGPTLFVKLQRDPLGVRCLRCAAWPASMAMATV